MTELQVCMELMQCIKNRPVTSPGICLRCLFGLMFSPWLGVVGGVGGPVDPDCPLPPPLLSASLMVEFGDPSADIPLYRTGDISGGDGPFSYPDPADAPFRGLRLRGWYL